MVRKKEEETLFGWPQLSCTMPIFPREQLQLSLRKSGSLNAHTENAESHTAVYSLSSGPSVSLLQQLKVITFTLPTEEPHT